MTTQLTALSLSHTDRNKQASYNYSINRSLSLSHKIETYMHLITTQLTALSLIHR